MPLSPSPPGSRKNNSALFQALWRTADKTISLIAGSGGNMASTVAALTQQLSAFAVPRRGASVA